MSSTSSRALALLVVLSAAGAIASAPWALDQRWMNLVFKPLATIGLIALAWNRGRETPSTRRAVLAGLVFSLGGDVALMWPQQGFLPGLVSFLLAHLCYLIAFTRRHRLAARAAPFAFYAVVAVSVLGALWPGVPAGLRFPVVAYVVCLAAMAAQSAVVWSCEPHDRSARRLAAGGALFLTSDALLATNRFAVPLPAASLWILATYWLAQACIAGWLAAPPAPPKRG